MRTLVIIFSIITLVAVSSCNQKTDTNAILENSETRSEILKTITGNHNYMMEFMESMHNNEHAMQMMQGNQKMMGMMMKGNGMKMMMKDSMMTKNIMHSMMKDGKMMGNMMQMMHKEGMMGEDCMKSCMKMMENKGMNVMNGDEKEVEEDHSEHH